MRISNLETIFLLVRFQRARSFTISKCVPVKVAKLLAERVPKPFLLRNLANIAKSVFPLVKFVKSSRFAELLSDKSETLITKTLKLVKLVVTAGKALSLQFVVWR